MSRLLIGVTGGIAAYKAIEIARLAIKAGHAVRVIQTENSRRFIGPDSFAGITGAPVLSSEFESDPMRGAYPGDRAGAPTRAPITHLALVQRADAYLIAPASADTIARLAAGIADGLVTTAALAADCPVLVAPAMNDRMYRHPATQANLALLSQRGVTVVGPDTGQLASHGEHGAGRMTEPAELLAAVEAVLATPATGSGPAAVAPAPDPSAADLLGLRVLVTAGGTREPIDAVRYIGNRSSGRMGFALAAAAARRGAQVTLVAANTALPGPDGVDVVTVGTAQELLVACERAFERADVLLMAAAVADYRPRHPAAHKLKKTGPDPTPPRIELELTTDVLATLSARRRPGQTLVGFAAEHGAGALEYGRGKLARKGLDAVVVNDVSVAGIGFDSDENEVTVLCADGSETHLARAGKDAIAHGVLDRVAEWREEASDVGRAGTDAPTRV